MIACSGSKPKDEERKGRQGSKAKGFSMVFMDQLWAPEIGFSPSLPLAEDDDRCGSFESSNDNMDRCSRSESRQRRERV